MATRKSSSTHRRGKPAAKPTTPVTRVPRPKRVIQKATQRETTTLVRPLMVPAVPPSLQDTGNSPTPTAGEASPQPARMDSLVQRAPASAQSSSPPKRSNSPAAPTMVRLPDQSPRPTATPAGALLQQPLSVSAVHRGEWFDHDRFGLFIHWGLYSLAARQDWVQHYEKIPAEVYRARYFDHFDPDRYDPTAWAEAAVGAGMRYVVATTKHHDGFCLWDSELTDYTAARTPAGRDLIRPLVEAFRARDCRIGLYHSLIDWHHPHFVLDPHTGPYRGHPKRDAMNQGREQAKYARYLRGQVYELLSRYGQIDVMWLDFSYPRADGSGKGRADWESEALVKEIRALQPNVLLNDRCDLPGAADFRTPEQVQPRAPIVVNGRPVRWEACHTMGGTWGYHRDEANWKSVDQLVRLLIDSVSKGGNFLLNVSPTGRGELDERTLDRLSGIGRWMRRHGRSIYGCGSAPAEFIPPPDSRLTYNPATRRLYVHLFAWPFAELHLEGLGSRAAYAQLLNDASELPIVSPAAGSTNGADASGSQTLTLRLPTRPPDVAVPVVELFLK